MRVARFVYLNQSMPDLYRLVLKQSICHFLIILLYCNQENWNTVERSRYETKNQCSNNSSCVGVANCM